MDVAPLVRAAAVVAETEFNLLQEAGFPLAPEARQIREKRARVAKVEARIVGERVVLEGLLQGDIYYAGWDNRVHHHRQDITFQALVHLPGAGPGMDVWVEGRVDDFLLLPAERGEEIPGKIFLGGKVIITRKENLQLVAGTDYLLQLPVLTAHRGEEVLVQHSLVPSPPPAALGAMEARLLGLSATALANQVAVAGSIREDLYYTGPGGVEYHWQEAVPFRTVVPVPGAETGDEVEVRGRVEGVFPRLEGEGSLTVKVVVALELETCRLVQLGVKRGPVPLRASLVVGENTRERLLADRWLLNHQGEAVRSIVGRVKKLWGQAVFGQVLLEGILEKEVTYTGAGDGIQYHQVREVPLTDFLTIPGAREGLPVQAAARVVPGGWKLERGRELEERMILELYGAVLETAVVHVAVEE